MKNFIRHTGQFIGVRNVMETISGLVNAFLLITLGRKFGAGKMLSILSNKWIEYLN
jgi:hypothetical protein